MPRTCCTVPGCFNRGGHQFPANRELCKLWVIAIRRVADKNSGKLWWPSQSSVVCRSHFKTEDYKHTNSRGFATALKILKDGAVPSAFNWTIEESETARSRKHRAEIREDRRNQQASTPNTGTVQDAQLVLYDDDIQVASVEEVSAATGRCQSQFVQTENKEVVDSMCQTMEAAPILITRISVDDFKNDSRGLQFYTGLDTYQIFMDAYISLGPAVDKLEYLYGVSTLPAKDQFFMTLVKLRLYKTNFELSRMFKVTELEVYSVLVTWIRFMSLQWREIDIWPDRDTVQFYAPSDFKRKFPQTRAVFDGTECPIQKPKAPAAQQVTFSTYKNRTTAKVLIGVTPGGQVSYVSPSYGGSTSDRQIVERSHLTRMFDPKDTIMADKGFDVQDIFAPMDVTVNIPTFFKKKNRMSGKTVLRDRAVASKRVHVERVIGLGKTYKILCHPMNQSEVMLSSDIIFVCYMLVNFRNCIVPHNA